MTWEQLEEEVRKLGWVLEGRCIISNAYLARDPRRSHRVIDGTSGATPGELLRAIRERNERRWAED